MSTRRNLIVLLALLLTPALALADDEVVTKPVANSPEATVAEALTAGLAGDFDAYLETVHPEHKETPEQRRQRKKYEWSRFERQATWYVRTREPLSFVVTRRAESGDYVRVFLRDQRNRARMPVPVRLKKAGDGWKIVTSSL
jgi:hypothetical protein